MWENKSTSLHSFQGSRAQASLNHLKSFFCGGDKHAKHCIQFPLPSCILQSEQCHLILPCSYSDHLQEIQLLCLTQFWTRPDLSGLPSGPCSGPPVTSSALPGHAPWEPLLFCAGLQQQNVNHTQAGAASSVYIHPALCIRALGGPLKSGVKSFHDMQLVGRGATIKK